MVRADLIQSERIASCAEEKETSHDLTHCPCCCHFTGSKPKMQRGSIVISRMHGED